jgi:hypothetical protein
MSSGIRPSQIVIIDDDATADGPLHAQRYAARHEAAAGSRATDLA